MIAPGAAHLNAPPTTVQARWWGWVLCGLSVLGLIGCGKQELETRYASLQPETADSSVNGLGVFAQWLRDRGHQVRRASLLHTQMFQNADCIIWFVTDFDPPPLEVEAWLQAWLGLGEDRVLVIVLPDADMEWVYWDKMAQRWKGALSAEARKRRAWALNTLALRRKQLIGPVQWPWFEFHPGRFPPWKPSTLAGDPRWLHGVQSAQTELFSCGTLRPRKNPGSLHFFYWDEEGFLDSLAQGELTQQGLQSLEEAIESESLRGVLEVLQLPAEYRTPISTPQGALVLVHQGEVSKVIAVANGSFLLNLGLVNPEHRKLAAALAQELGSPPRRIYFLRASSQLRIMTDLDLGITGFTDLLARGPLKHLLGHLLLLGVLAIAMFWPIFGRPVEPPQEQLTDFGQHLEAMGRLMSANAANQRWAQKLLQHYRQRRREIQARSGTIPRGKKSSNRWLNP